MATLRATPVWTARHEAIGLILRGRTARTAGPIAAIVGTVLSIVNQGGVVLSGEATSLTWIRIVINYVVPFTVASVAYLSACRNRS
ncbi:MAG: nitrate/nitrite transporter NrtS [Labedaea sp.]